MRVIDHDLALLVACGRWPPSAERNAAIRNAATAVDWDRFLRLVARHRMAGMAVHGLSGAGVAPPSTVGQALRAASRADLTQALVITGEALRLIAALAAAGIQASVLKGPPLAMTIYDTLAVRQMRDLDLLVAPADLLPALALLHAQDYVFRRKDMADLPLTRWAGVKDIELFHAGSGLIVELHGRLHENAALLPFPEAAHIGQVAVGAGACLPAMTGSPLLVYLIVHGFRHGWERLKWLIDVAAMIAAMDVVQIERFVDRMRARGMTTVIFATLIVLHDVVGQPFPPALEARARRHRRARFCAAVAIRWLHDEREPGQAIVQAILRAATLSLAFPHPRFIGREMARLLIDRDVADRLGRGVLGAVLSVPLKPFAWLHRKRRARRRRTPRAG